MTFVSEPYGVFVDDLLTQLTGGETREELVFLPENAPYRLGHPSEFLPGTVRLHGIAGDRRDGLERQSGAGQRLQQLREDFRVAAVSRDQRLGHRAAFDDGDPFHRRNILSLSRIRASVPNR